MAGRAAKAPIIVRFANGRLHGRLSWAERHWNVSSWRAARAAAAVPGDRDAADAGSRRPPRRVRIFWFAHTETGTLTRWDPSAGRVVSTFRDRRSVASPLWRSERRGRVVRHGVRRLTRHRVDREGPTTQPANRVGDAIALGDFAALRCSSMATASGRPTSTPAWWSASTPGPAGRWPRCPGSRSVMGFASGFGAIWASSDTGGLVQDRPRDEHRRQDVRPARRRRRHRHRAGRDLVGRLRRRDGGLAARPRKRGGPLDGPALRPRPRAGGRSGRACGSRTHRGRPTATTRDRRSSRASIWPRVRAKSAWRSTARTTSAASGETLWVGDARRAGARDAQGSALSEGSDSWCGSHASAPCPG